MALAYRTAERDTPVSHVGEGLTKETGRNRLQKAGRPNKKEETVTAWRLKAKEEG